MLICARSHHRVSEDADIFTVSPVAAYLMLGVAIFFCIVPFIPGVAGHNSTTAFFWEFSPFWLGAFAASAHFFRYQVIVRDNTITYGSFRRAVVPFSEVIDFDVQRNSSELLFYLKSGRKLKFSGMLGDFDELVGMVNSHMAGLPGPHHDSVAKIQDQTKRKHEYKVSAWFVLVNLAIVAIFVFVLWRMELLH
jgi:hypothetical protein